MLTTALVVIIFFRDLIAGGASNVVGAFAPQDIQVQAPADPAADQAPAEPTQPDAATPQNPS
jgi:hypothetical protein